MDWFICKVLCYPSFCLNISFKFEKTILTQGSLTRFFWSCQTNITVVKTPEQISKWTLSWDCFVNCYFQGQTCSINNTIVWICFQYNTILASFPGSVSITCPSWCPCLRVQCLFSKTQLTDMNLFQCTHEVLCVMFLSNKVIEYSTCSFFFILETAVATTFKLLIIENSFHCHLNALEVFFLYWHLLVGDLDSSAENDKRTNQNN